MAAILSSKRESISMRERAEMLGGKLEIHARPGNGTVVRAAVPVNGLQKPRT